MSRPHRNIIRLDYKVLHHTGKKVAVLNVQEAESLDNDSIMEETQVRDNMIDEIDIIVLGIEGFLEEYELEDLYSTEDIEKCISELKTLKERLEGAHVKLRRVLGENYKDLYKTYDDDVKKLTKWIKDARKEVNKRKRDNDEEKDENLAREGEERAKEMEQLAIRDREEKEEIARQENIKEREKIKAEGKYLKIRVKQCMEYLGKEHTDFIEDIEKNISEVKYMIETHGDLHSRMELVYGEDYEYEFGDDFGLTSDIMNQWIQDAKRRINILRQADKDKKVREIELQQQKELSHKEIEVEKALHEKVCNEKKYEEKVIFVKYMFEEIKLSANSLSKKYSISLESLDDNLLLDKRSDINLMDAEFNEVMSKVTDLVKEIPSKYDEETKILDTIFDIRNKLRISKDKYSADLEMEIFDRDLSSKKLQNASLLKIEVPKFRGYKSAMDIYTFQTEFEKLIAPSIRKKLLPDYLKKNYLDGQAYLLVKEVQDLDKIWDKLKESFGSTEILLKNKLSEVEKCGPISKMKDKEKLIPVLSKLINNMYDLRDLVVKHDIESELYHSSNLNIIYHLIGDYRKRKIKLKNLNSKVSRKEEWVKIISFLECELRLEEELLLDEKSVQQFSNSNHRSKDNENRQKSYVNSEELSDSPGSCFICGRNDHVTTVTYKGKKVINYIACEKFVKMNPSERFNILLRKKLCFQCLNPGLKGRHDGVCYDRYACKHESHKKFKTSKHVSVCDEHKNESDNIKLFEEYKSKFVTNSKTKYEDFSHNMKLSYYAGGYIGKRDEEQLESSIYMLQTIKINDEMFNLFYDSGCGDLVSRRSAVERLEKMGRASRELRGPIILTGVGDSKTVCEHGIYKVRISMFDGKEANLSGLCLDKVTQEFPKYELKEVAKYIQDENETKRNNSKKKLPKLPRLVGGDTDFMIGIKYLKYFPKEIFKLPSGLTIYESVFVSADGSRGVIGGPHRIFAEIERQFRGSHLSMAAYLTDVVTTYQNSYKLSLDIPLLGMKKITYMIRYDQFECC